MTPWRLGRDRAENASVALTKALFQFTSEIQVPRNAAPTIPAGDQPESDGQSVARSDGRAEQSLFVTVFLVTDETMMETCRQPFIGGGGVSSGGGGPSRRKLGGCRPRRTELSPQMTNQ